MELKFEDYISRVFDKNYEKVFKYVYKRVGDRESTQDISIEVFIEFIKFSKKQIPEDSEEVRKILIGISRNLIKGYYNREFNNKYKLVEINTFKMRTKDSQPDKELERIEKLNLIADVLETSPKLKQNHRICIFMHFFLGKSYKEIAKTLDISISQVRSYIEYGKILLKSEIERKMGNDLLNIRE